MKIKKPNLFIVGLEKSGTTSLHSYLSQHPQVFMSKNKEPSFFCKDFHNEAEKIHGKNNPYYRIKNLKDYLDNFKEAKNEKIIGESSPCYLFSEVSAKEIFKFNPKAKIIIILREPLSYLHSIYFYAYVRGYETAKSFEKALESDEQRLKGLNIPQNFGTHWQSIYSNKIKYHDFVKRYYKLFGRSQVKVILYDDYKKDNLKIYREVLKFLKIDRGHIPKKEDYNPSRVSRFDQAITNKIYHSSLREKIRKVLPYSIYFLFKDSLKKFLLKKGGRSILDKHTKIKYKNKFKPEVEKIGKLLKINLVKRWNYNEKN